MKDTGGEVKTVLAVIPQAKVAGALNGTGIDRRGYNSLVVTALRGADAGGASAWTCAVKVQDSADNSSFTDISGATGSIAYDSSSSGSAEINLDLRAYKRYVRVVMTPAFTGGSTPSLLVAASVALGQASVKPAV
ncbi:MAG: hypothetical protein KAS32_12925 [Candidatus Peribacteraceae bacterium]|nr:hypothetical protein [Candidatus Peribacteraceae bacterium]